MLTACQNNEARNCGHGGLLYVSFVPSGDHLDVMLMLKVARPGP